MIFVKFSCFDDAFQAFLEASSVFILFSCVLTSFAHLACETTLTFSCSANSRTGAFLQLDSVYVVMCKQPEGIHAGDTVLMSASVCVART